MKLEFINERLGEREALKSMRKERIISYKKTYKDKDKYIKELVDESKFENINEFKFYVHIVLAVCTIGSLALTRNIDIAIFFALFNLASSAIMFVFSKIKTKRELRIEIDNEEDVFERIITLEKDKNCISIVSVVENEKFNIADFLGVYMSFLVFRDKDKFKVFNIKEVTKSSLEEEGIVKFLEENKYDNEKNREVFNKVKSRFKTQYIFLGSILVYLIMGIAVVFNVF